ncbi:HD domain protein [Vibrio harveyi]|uniref:HD domain-containing protein n=1 Tax=Vibrio harveyi TaxID=669 RepID=UPI00028CEBA3|nr:HD domain-containing protein [Vibrio harveyi]EKM18224.1 HD domain protein [Vibrio harveyi]
MIDKLPGILTFLREAEQLKNTLRTAWTSSGRRESTAEHTWRLCLLAMLVAEHYPHLDSLKVLKLCVVHDLAEAVSGDISTLEQNDGLDKSALELADLKQLIAPLDASLQKDLLELWLEYDSATTAEARLTKALDKLETILQHTQGDNPADFNYAFNLEYGKKHTDFDDLTKALRAIIDEDTRRLAER